MTNLERAKDIYAMMGQGQLLEAFDKYYADNVVMIEPLGNNEGKEACRQKEIAFLESVESVSGMTVDAMAEDASNGKVLIQTSMTLTFKGAPGPTTMEQTSVQTWENGMVVHERFYYDSKPPTEEGAN